MKTKFAVTIHKNGSHNDEILKMITNHNEGLCNVDLSLFEAFIKAKKATYPAAFGKNEATIKGNVLDISEDGKSLTLTIEEREVFELELTASEADLLTQNNLS